MMIQAKYPIRFKRLIKVPGNGPFEVEDKLGEKMISAGIAKRMEEGKNKKGK